MMNPLKKNKALILLPTYNEAENIALLLERLNKEVLAADFLVIDDNSPDGTQNVIEELQKIIPHLFLLKREKKEGLAAAYKAGFRWGIENGYEFLLEMDADFSHDPIYVNALFGMLSSSDLVIGSRYIAGGGTPDWSFLRKFVSRGGNLYAKLLLGMKLSDLTGGFNAWRASLLRRICYETVASRGYAFQIELKYRAYLAGAKIEELPIFFPDRKRGKSKMSSAIFWEGFYNVWKMKREVNGLERNGNGYKKQPSFVEASVTKFSFRKD